MKPEDYRWSSAQRHLNGVPEDDDLLDAAFWQERGGAEGWRALLGRTEYPQLTYLLRRCTHAGRPFGDSSFLRRMEDHFGRKWKRWPIEKELTDSEMELSLEAMRPGGQTFD